MLCVCVCVCVCCVCVCRVVLCVGVCMSVPLCSSVVVMGGSVGGTCVCVFCA